MIKKVCLLLSLGCVYAPAFAGVGREERRKITIFGLKKKIEKEGILQNKNLLDDEHVNSGEKEVEHRKLVGAEGSVYLFDMDSWYGFWADAKTEDIPLDLQERIIGAMMERAKNEIKSIK